MELREGCEEQDEGKEQKDTLRKPGEGIYTLPLSGETDSRQANEHSAITEAELFNQVPEPDGGQSKVKMRTSEAKILDT